jgi:hypothetical protein
VCVSLNNKHPAIHSIEFRREPVRKVGVKTDAAWRDKSPIEQP